MTLIQHMSSPHLFCFIHHVSAPVILLTSQVNFLSFRSDSSTQQSAQSATTKTFVTALYLNAAVFGIELVAFTLLRRRFKAIYEPRTYLPPEK